MLSSTKGLRAGARFVLVSFAFFLAVPGANASSPRPVYWAGVAFTGAHGDRAVVAARTAATIDSRGALTLNRGLRAALARMPPAHLQLITDDLARLDGSTSATVLAAAFDREKISVEVVGGQHKLLIEVAVQALFFDFRERQIIASYPLTLQRIDVTAGPPTPAQIDAGINTLLFGSGANDLPQAFARTLLAAKLPGPAVRRLQLVSVTFSEGALAKLPGGTAVNVLGDTLAHEFSKSLSARTGVGLLPSASGEAVGGVMAARFADGAVYQLKIPAPDYEIRLRVDGLRNGIAAQTPAMKTMLFGAFFNVQVEEPMSKRVYFDQPLRKGATKVVPASQTEVDTWSASYDTLLAGFDAFSGAAAARPDSRAWLAEQKPGGRTLSQQTQALQELINSCR